MIDYYDPTDEELEEMFWLKRDIASAKDELGLTKRTQLAKRLQTESKEYLYSLFDGIKEYDETGIIPPNSEYDKLISKFDEDADEELADITVRDIVLFEMAKRYFEENRSTKKE